jgi:biotin transport system substrate-specific component
VGTIGLMVVGNLVIYAIGLPWLMVALGVDLSKGLEFGVTPFLIGDGLKVLLAAGLLPGTWRLVGAGSRER